jgi:hypothetical protein
MLRRPFKRSEAQVRGAFLSKRFILSKNLPRWGQRLVDGNYGQVILALIATLLELTHRPHLISHLRGFSFRADFVGRHKLLLRCAVLFAV